MSYKRSLATIALASFIASLATFSGLNEKDVGASLLLASGYALIVALFAHEGIRRSAIAIEASGTPFDQWVSSLRSLCLVCFGTLFVLSFFRGQCLGLTLFGLIGMVLLLKDIPLWVSRAIEICLQNQAFHRLQHGGTSNGPRRASAQGHRIHTGSSSTPPFSSAPSAKPAPLQGRWRLRRSQKPLAPSPLEDLIQDRDFLNFLK